MRVRSRSRSKINIFTWSLILDPKRRKEFIDFIIMFLFIC